MSSKSEASKLKRASSIPLEPLPQKPPTPSEKALMPYAKAKARPSSPLAFLKPPLSPSNGSEMGKDTNLKDQEAESLCSVPPRPSFPNSTAGSVVSAVRQLRKSSSSVKMFGETARKDVAPQGTKQKLNIMKSAFEGRPSTPPADLETCSICLDHLSGQALGVCLGKDGHRTCQHYFHIDCLQRVEGAHCPQCRVRFHKRSSPPSIEEDPSSWYAQVSGNGKAPLSMQEVSAALKATLFLSPDDVDALVESSWQTWSRGAGLRDPASILKMAASVEKYMPASSSGSAASQNHWEDESAKLEDGHTRSGVVCSCGQVHVRRGDRIRRGPMESDVDASEIMVGQLGTQLGTIVRIGQGEESVTIKWDRCEQVYSYTWPDPEGLFLAPAGFGEMAQDVIEVQKQTGLSSAAAEESLRLGAKKSKAMSEEQLRKAIKPYHRVRILPDKLLVQQWFDGVNPCQCSRPNCSGGIQWSSRANKHLGREALVLKVDESDDTVLVETRGPCNCKIWYPRLAVAPAYDPDLQIQPEFKVGDSVECKMEEWEKGKVTEVLWKGAERTGPMPYRVTLDGGRDISVPYYSLIRRPR